MRLQTISHIKRVYQDALVDHAARLAYAILCCLVLFCMPSCKKNHESMSGALPGPGKSILFFETVVNLPNGNKLDLSWIFFFPSESSASVSKPIKEKLWRDTGVLVEEVRQRSAREIEKETKGFEGSFLQMIYDEPLYWPYLSFNDADNNEGRVSVFGVGGDPKVALSITRVLSEQFKANPLVSDVRVVEHKPYE